MNVHHIDCSAPGVCFDRPSMTTITVLEVIKMYIIKFVLDIAPKVYKMVFNLSRMSTMISCCAFRFLQAVPRSQYDHSYDPLNGKMLAVSC